ncbi:expressed unknown protein [Ectocarpus siliculosus]|uniref:Uncharacterized protein n=1 Tax=Ectocarpus siliculosus TaxID=2880 RepID=D8LJF2_ECTSI|nr:expressed unknown protein [Ectocarpus siliculosus]|eukprot:CBN79485.1 expressed unknown protein [Ectocarpus siliculosus]
MVLYGRSLAAGVRGVLAAVCWCWSLSVPGVAWRCWGSNTNLRDGRWVRRAVRPR